MKTGTLRQRIKIERLVIGEDAIGQPIEEWQTKAITWADIRHLSGLEAVKAGAEVSIVRASIRIRYMTGLSAAMRVRHDTATYNVIAVLQDVNKREYTDLICEAIE